MKNNKFIYLAVLSAVFASCEPEFENSVDANYSAGDADFTTYVAIGNSLTAGYMDGTVYKSGQMNSYPNMLAQQFALVGGGAFTQPSYEDDVNNLGGLMLEGMQIGNTRLVIDASQGRPENITGTPTIEVSDLQTTAYNNAGVPGAKSFHLILPGYGSLQGLGQMPPTANPYFVRTATSASATVLGDAMSLNPTFFTNWIGANDVLAYATNGGAQSDGMTPAVYQSGNTDFTTYGSNDITDPDLFESIYGLIINGGSHPLLGNITGLTSNGAKGVVATIPSVTSIPYFTTVKWNQLPAESTISAVPLYNFLSQVTAGRISALSTAAGTYNPILIVDEDLPNISSQLVAPFTTFITGYLMSLPNNQLTLAQAQAQAALMAPVAAQLYGKARQATANDLVVLTASSVIGVEPNPADPMANPFDVPGVTLPLANKYVLTANEKAKVADATAAYNNTIVALAGMHDLAVADMNALMNQLVSGLQIETGQIYTANYFSGSATEGQVLFSLDGVHPNARGYAVIANAFIGVINAHYNANLPLKYVNDYPGTQIVGSNN